MSKTNFFIVLCPHCHDEIIISENEINCAIFRHAVFKDSLIQINPHESKLNCDSLIENELVYGCAKPFKIVQNDDHNFIAIICDYI